MFEGNREILEWAEPRPVKGQCRHLWVPLTAGSDRAALAKKLADAHASDFSPALIDARVQGRVEAGVTLQPGKSTGPSLKKLLALLAAQQARRPATSGCPRGTPASDGDRRANRDEEHAELGRLGRRAAAANRGSG